MTTLQVSTVVALIVGIAIVPLTVQVGLKRIKHGIFFGDGSNMEFAQRRAAHSNFMEHIPFFMALLILCELNSAPKNYLYSMAGAMLAGRAFHAYSLLCTNGMGHTRVAGMILTFVGHLMGAGYLGAQTFNLLG